MAAMAGYVDDLAIVCHGMQTLDVLQLDTVVNAVPYPPEQTFDRANRGVGDMRRNLGGVLARLGNLVAAL